MFEAARVLNEEHAFDERVDRALDHPTPGGVALAVAQFALNLRDTECRAEGAAFHELHDALMEIAMTCVLEQSWRHSTKTRAVAALAGAALLRPSAAYSPAIRDALLQGVASVEDVPLGRIQSLMFTFATSARRISPKQLDSLCHFLPDVDRAKLERLTFAEARVLGGRLKRARDEAGEMGDAGAADEDAEDE